ncbi:imidazolonepropionase-like amidohydrolase [Advenella incenata]|uniref:Imidazolonepropionase-like amidohydrolase n=1 Tax=Advenella incenata TaxID=267800 RepID=A0A4Q7VFV4_9BURK|nr:amidohydrolase family protein [Advenella incenata]RZT94877.1 imidazolonepropionase-like amidohydrolase [Advenella incenata]
MSRVILEHANLIDGAGGTTSGITIIIERDRIADIVAGTVEKSIDDIVYDLTDKTVMPGMCIGHFHAEYNGLGTMPGFSLGSERPPGVTMAYAIKNMRIALNAGFTSALGTACVYDTDVCLEMAMAEGVCEGPRIVPCSPHIVATGAHFPATPWWIEAKNLGLEGGQCTGPDEFRKFIRLQAQRGARMMKLLPSGGHGFPHTHGMRNISLDELKAAINAAHERGAWIRGHVNYKDQIIECIENGIDIIDHADDLDDECIEAMIKHGTYYCPTIGMTVMTIRWDDTKPYFDFMQYYPKDEAYIERTGKILQRAQKAGVKMLIGDDYGPKYGFFPNFWGDEINMFVDEMGFEPAAVIEMVTANGAHFFNDDTGTIAKGKIADLLVLDFDPMKDGLKGFSDPAKNILSVMKSGIFARSTLVPKARS